MKVICIGDSNTWGYDPRSYVGDRYEADCRWVDLLADKTGWKIINEGVNGMCIPKKSAAFSGSADQWIIMLGTNDILQGVSAEEAANNMRGFLKCIPSEAQNILLVAPPALMYGAWVSDEKLIFESKELAKHYCRLAEELGLKFVNADSWKLPMAFDGVHLTESGHKLFAHNIEESVLE